MSGSRQAKRIAKRQKATAKLAPGCVCVPTVDWVWTAFAAACLQLWAPVGTRWHLGLDGSTIARKRNRMIENFLSPDNAALEWLFFLDSDMTPPPDTIEKLLQCGHDVVTAVCTRRRPPYMTCCGYRDGAGGLTELRTYGGTRNPIVEIDWAGSAALLIRRTVLERVPPPWFVATDEGIAEDVYFSSQVRKAGIPIFCETTVHVGHLGVTPIDLAFRLSWDHIKRTRQIVEEASRAGTPSTRAAQ